MAKGQKRTIDPKKVTTLEKWVQYNKSYGNVVMGPNNTFLVLDPESLDMENPIKTFTIGQAVDAIVAIQDSGLQEQALRILETGQEQRIAAVAEVNQAYREKEQELLKTILIWKTTAEAAAKSLLADSIGILQKELADLDTARRQAKYPHRYILEEKRLPRMVLNYATRDARVIQHSVYRTIPQTTLTQERILPIGAGTA
jgi:hypothetical protein